MKNLIPNIDTPILNPKIGQPEEIFRSIFEYSSLGMALVNDQYKYVEVNQSFCNLLGYQREELLELSFLEITFEEDREEDRRLNYLLYKGDISTIKREKRYYHREGHLVWASLRVSVVRDQRGKFLNFVTQVEDISVRKGLEHSLKKNAQEYKSLFEQNPAAVLSFDKDGYCTMANHAALKLFGFELNELQRKHVAQLFAAREVDRVNQLFIQVRDGQTINFDIGAVTAAGGTLDLNVMKMPLVVDGNIEGVHCIAFNVTEEKNRQQEKALISKVSEIFNKEQNLEECLRILLYELCQQFQRIQIAESWITDFEDDELKLATQFSISGKVVQPGDRSKFKKGHGLIGKAWWDKKEIFIRDLDSSSLFDRKEFAQRNGLTSALAVPVIFNKKVLSVLAFFTVEPVNLGEEIIAFGEQFLLHLGSEIQRKKSEFELRHFFNITPDILYIAGVDGFFKKVNASFTRILGYSENIISVKPLLDFVHPDDKRATQLELGRLSGDFPTLHFENRCLTKDGSYKWLAWTATSLVDRGLLFGAARDITEKKLLEQKVMNEQHRFIKVFKEAPVSMCILKGRDHILTHANEEYYKLTGKTDDIIGKAVEDIFPEFKEQMFIPLLGKVFNSGRNFVMRDAKFEIRQGDGKSIVGFVDFMYQPYRDAEGQVEGIFFFGVDVTERKLAGEEMLKLSLIAKNTINAVIITRDNGIIEWVNNAFSTITEYEYEETIGRKVSALLYGDETDKNVRSYINEKIKCQEPFECEILQYSKSGRKFWVEIHGQPVFDEGGKFTHYFNIETDITERKGSFDELVRKENEIRNFASHLNAVLEEERSRIAREIHDEFGQQLTGLKMSLSTLKKQAIDIATQETINDMLKGIESTVAAMRKFSNELRPVILDTLGLGPSIEWLVNEFRRKTGIRCLLEISDHGEKFEIDFATAFFRICQEALTNIAKHARASQVKVSLIYSERVLTMEISDDGVGLQDETKNNPFSMGLTSMRERAKLINASIEIRSDLKGGTSVTLASVMNPK